MVEHDQRARHYHLGLLLLLLACYGYLVQPPGANALSRYDLAYYDHLSDRGIVAFTRWYGSPPLETLRLLATAAAALAERGVTAPGNHVPVLRPRNLATTAIKRQPFHPAEVANLRAFVVDNGFALLCAPLPPADEGAVPAGSSPAVTGGIVCGNVGRI